MEYSKGINSGSCTISMSGEFTFSDHQSFREVLALLERDSDVNTVIIDLEKVSFMDSAALGMLLVALDASQKNNVGLMLQNPQGKVKKLFELSKLYDSFDIRG